MEGLNLWTVERISLMAGRVKFDNEEEGSGEGECTIYAIRCVAKQLQEDFFNFSKR